LLRTGRLERPFVFKDHCQLGESRHRQLQGPALLRSATLNGHKNHVHFRIRSLAMIPLKAHCCGTFVARWAVDGQTVATWRFQFKRE
jgi:hypothetical protein